MEVKPRAVLLPSLNESVIASIEVDPVALAELFVMTLLEVSSELFLPQDEAKTQRESAAITFI